MTAPQTHLPQPSSAATTRCANCGQDLYASFDGWYSRRQGSGSRYCSPGGLVAMAAIGPQRRTT